MRGTDPRAASNADAHVAGTHPTVPSSAPTVLVDAPGASSARLDGVADGPLTPGRDFAGRYHVRRLIGVGGMGAVYQAWDTELGEHVAIKLLRPEVLADRDAAASLEARFKRELLLARRVVHANVVRIHDLGTADGLKYITMSYVDGEDLSALLAREGRVAPERAVRIARRLCEAVVAVHAAGIVHRDLKPANVMIDAADRVWLADFGVARLAADPTDEATSPAPGASAVPVTLRYDGLTRLGARIGTPEYMPPEQARGERVDVRADVYGLGLILYDLLAGAGARASGTTAAEELEARMLTAPPRIAAVRPDVPAALDRLLAHALDPDPARRPASAAAFADALAVLDRPGGTAEAHGERGPRRRFALAAAAVAACALAAVPAWIALERAAAPSQPRAEAGATGGATALPARSASLVVLPFTVEGGADDLAYLADGVSEDLRDRLARVPGLQVPGRRSSTWWAGRDVPLAEVARALGVIYALQGTLSRGDDGVRLVARLVRVADGTKVWSESRNLTPADLLTAHDDLARGVGAALGTNALPPVPAWSRAPTPQVRDLQLQARALDRRGTEAAGDEAHAFRRRIVELAPDWAPGWVDLSLSELGLSDRTNDPAALARARAAVERAIELAPDYANAYAARAFLRMTDLDWPRARADLDRALVLAPSDPLVLQRASNLDAAEGRLDEAIAAMRRVVASEPMGPYLWMTLGYYELAAGRHAEARASIDRALALDSEYFYIRYLSGLLEVLRSRPDAALAEFARMEGGQWSRQGRALAYRLQGDENGVRAQVRALHEEFAATGSNALVIAEAHAWLGERDTAFQWLERAYQAREPGIPQFLKNSPLLANLRDDPRYAAFVGRVGLSP